MDNNFSVLRTKPTLAEEIENQIERLIISKEVKPGDKLPSEKELCVKLGVSRTSLREALQMLKSRGLIKVKKGSGIFINDYNSDIAVDSLSLFFELNFSREYMMHVIHARQALEPQIAKIAAQRRTDEQLAAMHEIIDKLKECSSDDYFAQGDLDRKFHLKIAEASQNPVFPLIMDPIFRQMPKARSIVYEKVGAARSSAIEYHMEIYQAIKDQNSEQACLLMMKHLELAELHSRKLDS